MARWELRSKTILFIGAVLGTLIGIRVEAGIREAADELARLDFSLAATQRSALIREALRAPVERLDALARFFENSDDVSINDFTGFLYPWITAEEGIRFSAFDEEGARRYGALDGDLQSRFNSLARECDAGQRAASDIIGNSETGNPRLLVVKPIQSRGAPTRYIAVVADIETRVQNALRTVEKGSFPTSIMLPGKEPAVAQFDASTTGISPDESLLFHYIEAVEVSGVGIEIRVDASREYLIRRKNDAGFLIVPGFALLFALLAYTLEALLRRGDRAERQKAQALKELEHFFSIDLDLFCITDAQDRFTRVNPAWEKTFGYSEKELIGTSFLDFVHPEDREIAIRAAAPGARKKEIADFITRVRKKDGQWLRVEWKSAALGNNCYMAARDVTDREEYEARLRKTLSEKETLLREVHHRVKNNMQIISSLLNLQGRDLDDPALSEKLESAQGRIRTMAMVHDALYHSTDFTDIDFDEYASNIASACVYGLDRRNFAVDVRPSGIRLGLDLAIPCGLILNELVGNSARYAFAKNGPTSLTIELLDLNERLELIVEDNGAGFRPDFNLDRDAGLGLKLVTSLASQLGGKVERESGAGSRFRILIKPFPGSYNRKG